MDEVNDSTTKFLALVSPEGDAVVRVTTARSVWELRGVGSVDATYVRRPRVGLGARERSVGSAWGRLDDDIARPCTEAWWGWDGEFIVLRIRPIAGPPNGQGLVSSPVVAATGCRAALRLGIPTNVPELS